jgi:hypothetical protein
VKTPPAAAAAPIDVSPGPAANREAMARAQAAFVAALTGGAGLAGEAVLPDGFDAGRLAAAARSLAHKRRRSAERAWPALAAAVGPPFAAAFDAYAAEVPLPSAGPTADARAFAAWLLGRGELPAAGARLLTAARASRGWPVRVVRGGGVTIVAVRLLKSRVVSWTLWRTGGPPATTGEPSASPRRGDGL